jgi:hypothetical protein
MVMAELSEVRDYDDALLQTIRHIEDINVKFALQNYAAAGAVFVAYYAGKMPLKITAWVVVVLSLIFTWAICSNIVRYSLFWKMHRIARNHWLASQSELSEAFRRDPACENYLRMTALPRRVFFPVVVISLLPAIAAIILRVI